MGKGIIVAMTWVFVFISTGFAQDLKISPVKLIYTRDETFLQNPIKDDDEEAAHNWEAVTVVYPHLKGMEDTLLQEKIAATLDQYYLQDSLGSAPHPYLDLLGKFGQGLHDYQINYQESDFLDITFHWKLVLGHLFETFHTIIVDLNTGERVKPNDVLMNSKKLVSKIRAMQKAEIKQVLLALESNHEQNPVCAFVKRELKGKFSAKNIPNFSISSKGITFKYGYNREYSCANYYPSGNYFLSWREAKPFIKPTGLFGNFVPADLPRPESNESAKRDKNRVQDNLEEEAHGWRR